MKNSNKTIRKILSIALCLIFVMSYVPMVSITAGAAESTIPVIEGYGFDSDDSDFGAVFINPITSDTSATGTSWSDEAGKGNLIFQWGYGDTLDVTLVEPDGVVTYETSNIQPHSDDSKSADLHWTEFSLSSTYEDGTFITATRGFDNYINDEFGAYGTGSVANVFTQTASGDPSFLSAGMLMYGESIIENGTTSMSFDHIPATFRFIITNTHEKALSLESVTLRVVDADGTSVPAAAKYCNIEIEAENRYPELFYGNFAYSTYDSVTTNLSDYTLESGESYIAYALVLPLGKVDTGKHDGTAFEGKTIQVEVTTSEGECIAFELAGDDIANANPNNAYNWVGGKSYTMRMETRCYDGCAFDITGKCTDCGYECTHNFDDKGFCSDCGSYQPAVLNANGYYEINNAGQLYWFARLVNIEGVTDANAILTESVDLEGRLWYPIGLYNDIAEAGGESVRNQYKGTFDGNFHTVSNFTAIGTGSQGFIGYSDTSAVVKNLGVIGATVSGWNAGAVMAYMGTVENCYAVDCNVTAYTTVNTSKVYAGAVAGTQQATVVNSFAYNCEIIVGEGWAEKSSVSGIGGVTATNSYYLSETETEDGGKTAEQFASGEVAYLLQGGNSKSVWGQDNNRAGAKPMFTSNELYKVVTVGETGNYSVANVGDTNGDGTVDEIDYQALVNKALADDHEQIETASYDDIIKYNLDGNGYLNVLDASLMERMLNGHISVVDVYAVGDYDLNGIAFEEADIKAIKHAIENPEKLATYKKYASDINGDGKLDENDLTALTAKYGEVTGAECADNVEVYYRWGNKCSTCTATVMCTLCGEKVAVETVNTTSETLAELTCTQDGVVKYTATFTNETFEEKVKTVTEKAGHTLGELKDNGDGTHSKSCVNCDYVERESNEHSFDITNGECICGAKKMHINSVTVAGWVNGGTINAGLAEKADDASELSGKYFGGLVPEGELLGSDDEYSAIGVTVTNENNNSLYQADNIMWYHNGSGWYTDTAPLWDTNTVVSAYYPYINENASSSLSYSLYHDMLYGSATGTTGSLTLERKLASLVLRPAFGSEIYHDEEIVYIWISGIYTEGTFDAKTGILTPGGDPKGAIELKDNGDGTWETGLIPMDARTVTLTIRMSNGEYYTTTVELPAVEAGKQYDMTVQVGKSKVNIGNLQIEPWSSMSVGDLENDGNTHGTASEFPNVWFDDRYQFKSGQQITLILTDGTTIETHVLTVNEYGFPDPFEIITGFSSGRYYAYYGTNVRYDAESGLTVTVPTDQSTAEKLAAAETLICSGTFESEGYIDLRFEKPQAKLLFNVGCAGFDADPTLSDIKIYIGDIVIDAYLDGNGQIVAYIPEAELYWDATLITMKINGKDAVVYMEGDYKVECGTAYSFNLTVGNPE